MRKRLLFPPALGLAISIALLAGCIGVSFKSNGERIYFTSTSNSGDPITYTGGVMMMRLACVNCHGPEGHGGTVRMMMYSFDVPNITWPVLTSPAEDRTAYTENSLKKAITTGIDPTGSQFEAPMPVWQMSDSDLSDLVAFIKTLK